MAELKDKLVTLEELKLVSDKTIENKGNISQLSESIVENYSELKGDLNELGLTDNTDASGASRMLRAAAYTYVAGVLSSALEIIRLLAIFGRDRD